MKIKYVLAASAALIITASSANAADVVETAPYEQPAVVAVPTFSWDGAYAGATVGSAWLNEKTKVQEQSKDVGMLIKTNSKGVIGGLYAGYNFEVGHNVILGAETDFTWGNVKQDASVVAKLFNTDYKVTAKVKQSWAGATRLRVGYAMDRFMPFIAGGVAYSKIATSYKISGDETVATTSNSRSKTLTGWTIGAGVDYAVTDNILVRFEYSYADYGKTSATYAVPELANKVTDEIKSIENGVRVGIAYKF